MRNKTRYEIGRCVNWYAYGSDDHPIFISHNDRPAWEYENNEYYLNKEKSIKEVKEKSK